MINVKLFGQPTSTYEFTKNALLKEVARAGVKMRLTEINDVNEFIKEGIKSVPTIRINDHVEINYSGEKEITRFLRESIKSILKEEDFGVMAKVVVPTDFSSCSVNAVNYALDVFQERQAVVKIVHAYHPVAGDINGISVIDPHIESQKRSQLEKMVSEIQVNYPISNETPFIDGQFLIGYPAEEIIRLSKSDNADFIVLGNTGKGEQLKKWFGSVSVEVATKAHCPVLIVPPKAQFKTFKNIVYASDNAILDFNIIQDLILFLGERDYVLHLTHVQSDNNNLESHLKLAELLKNTLPDTSIVTKTLENGKVMENINEYAKEKEADLIVMAREKRTLWKELIHKSSTRQMAINTDLPLLIYHEYDKSCRSGGISKKSVDSVG